METLFDSQGFRIRFADVVEHSFDVRPLMAEIGQILIASIEENFIVGGRYKEAGSSEGGSKRWAPLAASAGRNSNKEKRRSILIRSGVLKNAFTPNVSGNSVTITNNMLYFETHQFGRTIHHPGGTPFIAMGKEGARFLKKDGKYPPGVKFTRPHLIRIPARPMMVVQDEDIEDIVSAAEALFIKQLGRYRP